MSISCLAAWAAVLILLPIVFILWASESKSQRINRWRNQGLTWRTIANRYNVSTSTVRRWSIQNV